MKKLLIISPYFPPVNAADMQRVRMSLPYFKEFGWDVEVVAVDEAYADIGRDDLLLQSVPTSATIHKVKALDKALTSKVGLGSIALRSLWFYRQTVDNLLKEGTYHLIYFSTTQFPVCILGAYWKKRFSIPYVIDMQDPWHSEYYLTKPKIQRPPKYWFSYRLNKYLEPIAIKNIDGLISVSEAYITDLKSRYPGIRNTPSRTITFGASDNDLIIANNNKHTFKPILSKNEINIVYIGRGGTDLYSAVSKLFSAVADGLQKNPGLYQRLKLYFIGTSYATLGHGKKTITPLATQFGVTAQITEITDRISYFQTLNILQEANGLFLPGSDDPKYTASKIHPYLSVRKPILAILNKDGAAMHNLQEYQLTYLYSYQTVTIADIDQYFKSILAGNIKPDYNEQAIRKHSARQMALEQCKLFDEVIVEKSNALT